MFIDPPTTLSTNQREKSSGRVCPQISVRKMTGIMLSGLLVGSILLFLILPTLIIIPMSFSATDYLQFPPRGLTWKWYESYFLDPDWIAATWFSLKIAAATMITSTIVGTMAALAIVRGDLPFRGVFQSLALGPMIVPHVVFGVALYLVLAPHQMTGTLSGFLIGHTVLAVPFVVITVIAALERFDTTLELAAMNCGAGRIKAFFYIILPDIAPGIASGAIFAFLASFDEATVAFFISDTNGKTIGRKFFEDIDFNLTPTIAAASTIFVVGSILLIGLSFLLSRPKQA